MYSIHNYRWSSDDDEIWDGTPVTEDDTEEEDMSGGDFLKSIKLERILEQVKNMPNDPDTREEYQSYLEDVGDLVRFLKRVIWRNTKVSKLGQMLERTGCLTETPHKEKAKASSTTQH